MDGTFENELNVQLVYDTLARILGEQYGVKITATVRPMEADELRKGGSPGVDKTERNSPAVV